jgi:hypothetical protein
MQKEIKETTEKAINVNRECGELKTIKYKTLLMNGTTWPETKSSSDLVNLDKFLENEKNSNASEPWSKLDKTAKIKKLTNFAENYKTENNLILQEIDLIQQQKDAYTYTLVDLSESQRLLLRKKTAIKRAAINVNRPVNEAMSTLVSL